MPPLTQRRRPRAAPAFAAYGAVPVLRVASTAACSRARGAAARALHRPAPPPPRASSVPPPPPPREAAAAPRATAELHAEGGGDEGGGPDLRPLVAAGFVAFVVGAVGVGATTGGLSGDSFVALTGWFESLGPWGIVAYSVLYFVLEVLALPATPLTIAAGYLFGVREGTAGVSVAATGAAAVSFLIARYGLRDYVTKVAKQYPKYRSFDRAIGREGLKFVFLLRLSPLLPFALSNYLYGLTSVKFKDYILASWAGMLPGTIAYVSAGAAVSALTDLSVHKGSASPALIVLGVAATIGAITGIGKIASAAISDNVDGEEGVDRASS